MIFPPIVHSRLVPLLVLLIGLAGCASQPQQPAADTAGKAQKAAGVDQTPLEELPDRDIEGMDVCALLPGSAVASAVNLPLAEIKSRPTMCSYILDRDPRPDAVIDVSLTKRVSFIFTRSSSENAKDLPGLGVAAFTRKVTGIHQDLWVARKDGLFLHIAAYEPDMAEPVARVALETIP